MKINWKKAVLKDASIKTAYRFNFLKLNSMKQINNLKD